MCQSKQSKLVRWVSHAGAKATPRALGETGPWCLPMWNNSMHGGGLQGDVFAKGDLQGAEEGLGHLKAAEESLPPKALPTPQPRWGAQERNRQDATESGGGGGSVGSCRGDTQLPGGDMPGEGSGWGRGAKATAGGQRGRN